MAVYDFHAHILPAIDDGSRNVDTTLELLRLSKNQGVDYIVATPHFYANEDKVSDFLSRREEAGARVISALKAHPDIQVPEIYIGAEVAFFPGISQAEEIDLLTIKGTRVMLLEMPFSSFTDRDIEEVRTLCTKRKLIIVLAHVERFFGFPGNKAKMKELMSLPLYCQTNAESMEPMLMRRRMLKLIKNKEVTILGSDTHSLHRRPPNLKEGRDVIEHKLGKPALDYIDQCSASVLPGAIPLKGVFKCQKKPQS